MTDPKSPPAFWDCRQLIKQSPLPAAHKHLLSVLHEYAGDDRWAFPHQNTLATACGWSVRQLQRHLAALTDAGLLQTERRQTGNRYAVVWETLSDPTRSSPSSPPARSSRTRRPPQVPSATSDASQTPPTTSITSTDSSPERPKNIPAGVVVSTKTMMWERGGLAASEFGSFERAAERFDEAVAAGACVAEDRLRFLTLWAYVDRRRQPDSEGPPIRNPGGFFARCLTQHDWAGAAVDEDCVRTWLKPPATASPAPLVPLPTAADEPVGLPVGDFLAEFHRRRDLALQQQRQRAAEVRHE